MRTAFIDTLCELAEGDPRIWLLTADLGYSVLERFALRFPNRYINVGVAEQNLTGIAAGAPVRAVRSPLLVPTGDGMLGRVIDALGRPVDGRGPITADGFVALDWKDGRLVGIEILDATRHLHDDLLQDAELLE